MMDFDWITAGAVICFSSYATMLIVAETQPEINEYGEEEYTIPGYLLLAGAFVIKWTIKTAAKIIGYYRNGNKGSVIVQSVEGEEEIETSSSTNEYELVI